MNAVYQYLIRVALDLPIPEDINREVLKHDEGLLETAENERVAGLAAKTLLTNEYASLDLRRAAQAILLRNLAGYRATRTEVIRVTKYLRDCLKTSSICLKGVAFADRLYSLPYTRDIGDIDLLIAEEQYEALFEARIDEVGYSIHVPPRPEFPDFDSSTEERRKHRMLYSYAPASLVQHIQEDIDYFDDGFMIDLHRTSQLEYDLDLKRIFFDTTRNSPSISHNFAYPRMNLVDSFIFASWHLYKHGVNLHHEMDIATCGLWLKQVADWYRALHLCIRKEDLYLIVNRIVDVRAHAVVSFATHKVAELYRLTGSPMKPELEAVLEEIGRFDLPRGFDRLLESSWVFGCHRTSFWEMVFSPSEEKKRIEDEARRMISETIPTYHAYRCENGTGQRLQMVEPPFTPGSDRAKSHVLRGLGVTHDGPRATWLMCVTNGGLRMEILLEDQNHTIVLPEHATLPVPLEYLKLRFAPNSDSEIVDEIFVNFTTRGPVLFKTEPKSVRLTSHDWQMMGVDDHTIRLVGTIRSEWLQFNPLDCSEFVFGLTYATCNPVCSRASTVLRWPNSVLKFGRVLIA